jgi:hypothetical protein
MIDAPELPIGGHGLKSLLIITAIIKREPFGLKTCDVTV